MTLRHLARALLILAITLVVGWAVIDVGARTIAEWQAREDRPVTLTLLHWGGAEEVRVVKELIDRFEAGHPDIGVRRVHANDYDTKLKTMFAAGTPPDLFYLQYEKMPTFVGGAAGPSRSLAKNLDPFVERERSAGNAQWLEDFYPQLLDAFRWDPRQERTGRGQLYGLPKDFTTMVMYVNVDLFRRAGVTVPYDGWTWQQFRDAVNRIGQLEPNASGQRIYGGVIKTYPHVLRNIVWSFGGRFFGSGEQMFRDVRLDEPQSQAALRFLRRMRLENPAVYNPTGISKDANNLFLSGRIGVIGPLGRWMTPRYREIRAFEWDVVPVPHRAGEPPVSAIATVAWAMSDRTAHPDAAWELLKFLAGKPGQRLRARLGLAVPAMQNVAEAALRDASDTAPAHAGVFLDALEAGRLGQPAPYTAYSRILRSEMKHALRLGRRDPAQAVKRVEAQWQRYLSSPRRGEAYPPMPWTSIVIGGGVCALLMVVGAVWFNRRRSVSADARREARIGWLFVSPYLLAFLLFVAGPLVLALLLALTEWSALQPLSHASFAGLDNFHHMFTRDDRFYQAIDVTVYFTLCFVPVSQALALGLALLMNNRRAGVALFRTGVLMPAAVTGVVLATIWIAMFNNETGLINTSLNWLLGGFGMVAPDWFGTDAARAAVPALVIMGAWGIGGAAIIYLAGLQRIPRTLYQAARIDGIGVMRRFWHITLPMLSPIILFNVVMAFIVSFHFFTQAYIIDDLTGGTNEHVLLYVLYIYKAAFGSHEVGYASALAVLLLSVLLMLTALVFLASRRLVHYAGVRL